MGQYQIFYKNKTFTLQEDDALGTDIRRLGAAHYHLLHDGKSTSAEIIGVDGEARTVTLRLNGRHMTFSISTPLDQLIASLGFGGQRSGQDQEVRAPMPGVVTRIEVRTGDSVTKGQNLLTLEAMKMENIIKSPSDGIIDLVNISSGDKVNKNHLLLKLK